MTRTKAYVALLNERFLSILRRLVDSTSPFPIFSQNRVQLQTSEVNASSSKQKVKQLRLNKGGIRV